MGTVHASLGANALQVGVVFGLREEDVVVFGLRLLLALLRNMCIDLLCLIPRLLLKPPAIGNWHRRAVGLLAMREQIVDRTSMGISRGLVADFKSMQQAAIHHRVRRALHLHVGPC